MKTMMKSALVLIAIGLVGCGDNSQPNPTAPDAGGNDQTGCVWQDTSHDCWGPSLVDPPPVVTLPSEAIVMVEVCKEGQKVSLPVYVEVELDKQYWWKYVNTQSPQPYSHEYLMVDLKFQVHKDPTGSARVALMDNIVPTASYMGMPMEAYLSYDPDFAHKPYGSFTGRFRVEPDSKQVAPPGSVYNMSVTLQFSGETSGCVVDPSDSVTLKFDTPPSL